MAIEYNLGVVAGSLASLRPLFVRLGLTTMSSKNTSNKPSAGNDLENNKTGGSYQLNKLEGSGASGQWRNKLGRMNLSNRVQGESVLDQTVMGEHHRLEDTDEDSDSQKNIFKRHTQTIEENQPTDFSRGRS